MVKEEKVKMLVEKGAIIPDPAHVLIGEDVSLDRIHANGLVIYPGCKIFGKDTLIMSGVKLGYEGPVTVEDCQLGPEVQLRGGFFKKSTFLNRSNMGAGAHVREGCLLEEEANGAHTVGLKQTILFPFVTLGSLINFCDCLMAGGTSRKNHSEVGSSYIHFNYSANQDKVTASLIGDVPNGVMINQKPIFLGGQGGIVGPVRIGYGAVVAAGVICRKDVPAHSLVVHQGLKEQSLNIIPLSHYPHLYTHIKRRVVHNIYYVANLLALRQWYLMVRARFLKTSLFSEWLLLGAVEKIAMAVSERMMRLDDLADRMPESIKLCKNGADAGGGQNLLNQKEEYLEKWQDVKGIIEQHQDYPGDLSIGGPFFQEIDRQIDEKGFDYLSVIQGLEKTWSAQGTAWLHGIVNTIMDASLAIIPSFI